jgi:argininosuccinate lyase
LHELNLRELKSFSSEIEADVFEFISLEQTLARKNQIGGTSPERVFEALEEARSIMENE